MRKIDCPSKIDSCFLRLNDEILKVEMIISNVQLEMPRFQGLIWNAKVSNVQMEMQKIRMLKAKMWKWFGGGGSILQGFFDPFYFFLLPLSSNLT